MCLSLRPRVQLSMNQANDEVWKLARRIGEAQAQPEPSKQPTETKTAKVNTSCRDAGPCSTA